MVWLVIGERRVKVKPGRGRPIDVTPEASSEEEEDSGYGSEEAQLISVMP